MSSQAVLHQKEWISSRKQLFKLAPFLVLVEEMCLITRIWLVIEESHNSYGIVGINILGDSHLSYITNNAMRI